MRRVSFRLLQALGCAALLFALHGCVVSVDEPFVLGTAEYADRILPEYDKMVDGAYRNVGDTDGDGKNNFEPWFKNDETRKIRHEHVKEFQALILKGKRVLDQ